MVCATVSVSTCNPSHLLQRMQVCRVGTMARSYSTAVGREVLIVGTAR